MKKTIIAGTLAFAVLLGGMNVASAATPSPSQVSERLDSGYAKIKAIMTRIDAFPAKLTAHGIDPTSLTAAIADVHVKHDAAYAALTTFSDSYHAAGDTYTPEVRANFVAAKDALKAFKASEKNAVSVAKSLIPAA